MYDLIIVGAGPAGIFTALELLRKSSTAHKILLVEKGKPVEKRHCPKDKTGVCVNCKPYLRTSPPAFPARARSRTASCPCPMRSAASCPS